MADDENAADEIQLPLKMNLAQYAIYRGANRAAIRNAINAGKMTADIDADGHWVIDREKADAQLAQNINPVMYAAGKQRGKASKKDPVKKSKPAPGPTKSKASGNNKAKPPPYVVDQIPAPDGSDEIPARIPALIESQAKREYFKALTAELEHQEKQGVLINREKVRASAYRNAKIVREAFQNMPDRISAELAAENNIHKIHAKLTKAIHEVLENLSEIAKDL